MDRRRSTEAIDDQTENSQRQSLDRRSISEVSNLTDEAQPEAIVGKNHGARSEGTLSKTVNGKTEQS
jgi:hypothetical protein